jgi:hypothetical protein
MLQNKKLRKQNAGLIECEKQAVVEKTREARFLYQKKNGGGKKVWQERAAAGKARPG